MKTGASPAAAAIFHGRLETPSPHSSHFSFCLFIKFPDELSPSKNKQTNIKNKNQIGGLTRPMQLRLFMAAKAAAADW